jgi:hypothetical protein
MELKNAVAVCLIALVSATLVLLIARALDLQAASRLEPQLARIVEELEAIRKSGGVAPVSRAGAESEPANDAVMVYYFHGNMRCPTCRAIESQAHETVQSDFASQLESGEVIWKILNYEEPAGTELGQKFEIQMPVVVVARTNGGEIEDWRRLDQVWALVGDQPAFAEFIRNEISQMLGPDQTGTVVTPGRDASEFPVAGTDPPGFPVPQTADEPNPLRGQEGVGGILETADGEQPPNGSAVELMPAPSGAADIPVPLAPSDIPVPQ